jgi:4-hydroxy-3-methylbut-2-enyl diphosphate reductase
MPREQSYMALRIEKAKGIGFCFGVRRALTILEKTARERGTVETLGAIVHNQPVVDRLSSIGVRIASRVDDIRCNVVAISAHGVSPQIEQEIRSRHINIINTTCPFVHRAQIAARRLAKASFFVIVYGDAHHPEVKGVLGWAGNNGLASLEAKTITELRPLPRRIGVLSQTTQIPAHFNEFTKQLVDLTLGKDSELRIVDTICHDIRERQSQALELAHRVSLMLVIGGHNSANTNRLAQICSEVTKTYLIETASEIQPSWLKGKHHIGITAGASTADETIDEVIARLKLIT